MVNELNSVRTDMCTRTSGLWSQEELEETLKKVNKRVPRHSKKQDLRTSQDLRFGDRFQ
jgi:Zn-finger nucleic acid-binding protein